MSLEDLQKQAVNDKKKIKVLKDALRDSKMQADQAEQQIQKLVDRNGELERILQEKENKYLELDEENKMMHEDIQELQEQLEEAGLFADGQTEENFENEFKKNGLKIPGKKVFKILKKQLNKQKNMIKHNAGKIKDGTGKLKDKIIKKDKDKKGVEDSQEHLKEGQEADPQTQV